MFRVAYGVILLDLVFSLIYFYLATLPLQSIYNIRKYFLNG